MTPRHAFNLVPYFGHEGFPRLVQLGSVLRPHKFLPPGEGMGAYGVWGHMGTLAGVYRSA